MECFPINDNAVILLLVNRHKQTTEREIDKTINGSPFTPKKQDAT